MANKYVEIDDKNMWSDRYEVQKAEPVDYRNWYTSSPFPTDTISYQRGHYQRSNETLKNGAVVFQWMGWRK